MATNDERNASLKQSEFPGFTRRSFPPMKIISRFFVLVCLAVAATPAFAQRAPAATTTTETNQSAAPQQQEQQSTSSAPQTYRAKYEGGVFGHNRRMTGTITFDDANNRLVFRNREQREVFTVPYEAILAAFADTRSRRPAAATVVGSLPVPYGLNLPALFIRRTYRYLTLQYRDPDTEVAGVTSFKLDNRQVLNTALQSLASRAGLTARGEIYVRRTEPAATTRP
jgi:hypothetical protein